MELTIQQIQDFAYCPKFYRLCHIDKLKKSKDANIENHFEDAVRKSAYHFFYCIQDGYVPSLKELRKKFGDLYIGERTIGETALIGRSHRNIARVLETRSISMLNNFYDKFSVEHGVPILIDKEYNIKVGNTVVKGTIPIIRETPDKTLEILHIHVDSNKFKKYTLPLAMKYDLPVTMAALAFEQIYKGAEQHSCYGVFSHNTVTVRKNEKHYKTTLNMIQSISTAIQSELFYPVLNHNCINCSYNKICAGI